MTVFEIVNITFSSYRQKCSITLVAIFVLNQLKLQHFKVFILLYNLNTPVTLVMYWQALTFSFK
ncbi:hypothetical protein CWC17_02835 [Pseudoalteromonas sp. S3785]|nr:hypothetical protein CWC17_02835 [Pseudoalteromonas sp. S3785]